MLVLGPEPGLEGRLWANSRNRVPVDGAAIASDVRESSCKGTEETTRRYETHERRRFYLTKTKDDNVPSKSFFIDDLLQLYRSLMNLQNVDLILII
ncbi:hypothetical protein AVEN_115636-1 [Araneus ventricosus]|uniref:Uncharacterized protein n=1 Tax=Araneus ventricosus TaxID=182803 RepID=A0A4Y2JRW5_ARAVE|nr:hypothetical protein AVEN_115636-1 [Araneus ventricosus]